MAPPTRRRELENDHLNATYPTEVNALTVTYRVGTDVEYAAAQEYGATITPKNGPFLVFEIDGETVFTKGPVTIPPHPYMRPAFDATHGAAAKVVGEVFGQLIKRAG